MKATTIALYAIFCLGGFELFAVTTVMPAITAELGGRDLYAVATSAALAGSILGMIGSGQAADRLGAAWPAVIAVALSLVGTIVVASAPTMLLFVLGRLLQGVGSGGAVSAAYVIAGRVYPNRLLPRAFGMFSSAFLLPALVGPSLSAAVSSLAGWRWMFVGLAVLLPIVAVLLAPSLRSPTPRAARGRAAAPRLVAAIGIAVAAIVVNVGGALPLPWSVLVVVLGLAAGAAGILVLMPAGVRPFGRGLGSLLVLRGSYDAALTTGELFIPLVFASLYRAEPGWGALVLSAGALAWITTSTIQARLTRLSSHAAVRLGAVLAAVGFATVLTAIMLALPPWSTALGWVMATAGGGFVFPRNSALLVEASAVEERGANSSTMLVVDSSFTATVTALVGVLFAAAGGSGAGSFGVVFGCCLAVGLAAVAISTRTRPRSASRA
ncbi:MFS transporter [Cnuibacter physcomitrellae]|uniref:MFS transporter n=1 Tax=Cnuibacter physcomitrellae TaxID=1619308 RepID=UPI002175B385|nr:MFS transporter [Cnuibacter physcomitrellae]MCS5498272.1 MFS transporter [Cnuibacter physcomitrellae]